MSSVVVVGAGLAGLAAGTALLTTLTLALASVLPQPRSAVASEVTATVPPAVGLVQNGGVDLIATSPPWQLPSDARPYIAAAGLKMVSPGTAPGFGVHLDIFDGRRRLPVPAGIGSVFVRGAPETSSTVRTTGGSGVIEVVARRGDAPTLGQFFTEWGVPFSATQVGGVTDSGADAWQSFVDGRPVTADPVDIPLTAGAEIELWFGPRSTHPKVIATYHFS